MNGSAISALVADLVAGELPESLHPTVWMGKWITRGRTQRRSRGDTASFVEGALVVGGGLVLTVAAATVLTRFIERAPSSARRVARGVALKPALSLRPLVAAARQVERALRDGELNEARRLLSWHLVSRDTSTLSESEVAGAAIESVAENLSDSVIAPLLAFRAGGLTAAYAYRFINTADAMLGYRTPELEWFGKTAARVDDVANFIPARVSAALIGCTAYVGRGSAARAWRVAMRDASSTASPNAGWPMAAMAGALNIALSKRDHYLLNANGRAPRARDIGRACRIVLAASAAAALMVDCV